MAAIDRGGRLNVSFVFCSLALKNTDAHTKALSRNRKLLIPSYSGNRQCGATNLCVHFSLSNPGMSQRRVAACYFFTWKSVSRSQLFGCEFQPPVECAILNFVTFL